MLPVTIAAVVGLYLAAYTLVSLIRLGSFHNNLGARHEQLEAEFRAFKAKWDYDGDPLPDREINELVQMATGKPVIARCLVCEELGHDCPTHDMGNVKDQEATE